MYFGERIKELRESKGLLQRHVAASLDMDTPNFSKIERGERRAKRAQVYELAKLLATSENELLSIWLADQVYDLLKDEDLANEALKLAASKFKKSK